MDAMEVYRLGLDCCVCGKPINVMQRRYTRNGITAHLACSEHVEDAVASHAHDRLTIGAFKERMREETQGIEKY